MERGAVVRCLRGSRWVLYLSGHGSLESESRDWRVLFHIFGLGLT